MAKGKKKKQSEKVPTVQVRGAGGIAADFPENKTKPLEDNTNRPR